MLANTPSFCADVSYLEAACQSLCHRMSGLRQHVKWLVMGLLTRIYKYVYSFSYSSCHGQWVQNVLTSCQLYKAVGFAGVHMTTRSQDVQRSTLSRLGSGAKERFSFFITLHYSALNVCC